MGDDSTSGRAVRAKLTCLLGGTRAFTEGALLEPESRCFCCDRIVSKPYLFWSLGLAFERKADAPSYCKETKSEGRNGRFREVSAACKAGALPRKFGPVDHTATLGTTSGYLRERELRRFSCKRHRARHLEFCPARFASRGSPVRSRSRPPFLGPTSIESLPRRPPQAQGSDHVRRSPMREDSRPIWFMIRAPKSVCASDSTPIWRFRLARQEEPCRD